MNSAQGRDLASGRRVACAVVLATIGSLIAVAILQARWSPLLLVVPALAAVGLRQRQPPVALAVSLIVAIAAPSDAAAVLPALLVLYGIGGRQTWSTSVLVGVAVMVAAALGVVFWSQGGRPSGTLHLVCAVVTEGAAALAVGLCVAARRRVVEEQGQREFRERELLTEQALVLERVRIARELHDVIAHNVSLMVVQAQALGATAGDPAVGATTDAIADLGRTTMVEMHRTLRLLRADGQASPLAPQPGLGDLAKLIEQTRAAGLDVDLVVEGEPRPLSITADLSAFRIVQEALTNVLKHAAGAATMITITYARDGLAVTIADGGAKVSSGPVATRGGLGLAGMRERAALFGGGLVAGPRPERGFAVTATLPYGAPAA